MKLILIAATAIAAIAVSGSDVGPDFADLGEYHAVSEDGPYSFLPASGYVEQAGDIAGLADLDGNPEIITAEEARMTGLLLDVLAGDPTHPMQDDAPLDGPALSDSEIVLAGL